ncbi:MAG: hypothetical protein ACOX4F_03300 [Atopobiaceae bacterium]|jgi:hypothetical protein
MASDFYDDEDPYFLVCDKLDAGEDPHKVFAWAKTMRSRAHDAIVREQWDEALTYIREEYGI